VIAAIRELTKLDMLRGVCPLCNDFESKIPPFIRPIFEEDIEEPTPSREEYQELSARN